MATGGNEQTASPLAEFGSFSVKDSAVNSTIHLCQCRDFSEEAYADKVRAIRAAALVWPKSWPTPSGLPGVEVQRVGADWDAVIGGLQEAESRGHRSVAVWAGGGFPRLWLADSIKPLSDYAASCRPMAATDIWVVDSDTSFHGQPYDGQLSNMVMQGNTSYLSDWQQELSADVRYQPIK